MRRRTCGFARVPSRGIAFRRTALAICTRPAKACRKTPPGLLFGSRLSGASPTPATRRPSCPPASGGSPSAIRQPASEPATPLRPPSALSRARSPQKPRQRPSRAVRSIRPRPCANRPASPPRPSGPHPPSAERQAPRSLASARLAPSGPFALGHAPARQKPSPAPAIRRPVHLASRKRGSAMGVSRSAFIPSFKTSVNAGVVSNS
jgi:hypothetical protein